MLLCNCPKCNSKVIYKQDSSTKLYYIECDTCKKEGITIRVENFDLITCIKKWNNRPLIDFLLKDLPNTINFFKFINGENYTFLKDNTIKEKYEDIYLNTTLFLTGWMIFKNNTIIPCYKSHLEVCKEYLNININVNIEDGNAFIEKLVLNGAIRITFYGKAIGIDYNKKALSKQNINTFLKCFYDNYTSYLQYIKEFIFNDISSKTLVFNTFDEAVLYIDSIK